MSSDLRLSNDIEVSEPDIIWEAALEDARQDLAWFGEMVWRDDGGKPITPARHHKIWIAVLEDESINRLLIIAPPEHAKTVWCSQIYPSWRIGQSPEIHYLHVSVTGSLAKLNSVAVRDTLEGNEIYKQVFPDAKPDKTKGWGESEWFLWREDRGDKDATFVAAGFDGPIIGRRANLICVDDPHSEETASSPTLRERTKRRFRRQVMSRLVKGGRTIVVTTRWHHSDLAADLIKDREGSWLTIHTPAMGDSDGAFAFVLSWDKEKVEAFANKCDQLGFDIGEIGPPPDGWGYPVDMHCCKVIIHRESRALWPERYPESALEQKRKDVGSVAWHIMYQGSGAPPEGKLFKSADFRYFEDHKDYWLLFPGDNLPPRKVPKTDLVRKIQYCDPAATEEQRSDYFALGTFGLLRSGEVLWLDLHHGKYETTKQPAVLELEYLRHFPQVVRLEAKAAGLALFQQLVTGSRLPVLADKNEKNESKETRAAYAAVHYENHRVYHPIGALWLSVAEEELLGFPDEAPHDDIVDVVSGGLKELLMNASSLGRIGLMKRG